MGYRDDREALRQKNEELEAALASAQTEIEKLRGRPPDAIDVVPTEAIVPARAEHVASVATLAVPTLALSLLLFATGVPPELFAPPLALLLGLFVALSRLVVLAGPNEAVVLSGLGRRRSDGTLAGFRVVHSGRALRRPFVETAARLDLGLFGVDVVASDLRLADGARAEARLAACAKLDSQPAALDRAVERFLGREPAERAEVVRSAVLAAARVVFARARTREAIERPEPLAAAIREEAEDELRRVGLTLWTVELLAVEEVGAT